MKKYLLLLLSMLLMVPAIAQLESKDYVHPYGKLSSTFYLIKKERRITIAFLGGSITQMDGWRELVCADLRKTYPGVAFTFINAGIPSLGSLPHAFRLQQDVLDKGPVDLLFIESAVNDKVNGTPVKTQQRALEGIIRHARSANPQMDIVLMAFADEYKLADYRAGKTPVEVQVHAQLAERYQLPFINLAKEVYDRIAAGEFTWEADFKDLHPSPFGQQLYFRTITAMLEQQAGNKTNRRRKSVPLPPPLDKGNYRYGHYQSIQNAGNLSGFSLIKDWAPTDKTPAREKFVHMPVLEGNQPGDSFTLNFEGPLIGIGVLSGPDAGKLEYAIDGKDYTPVNLYTPWSSMLHLPWFLMLADDLKPGGHQLKVRLQASQNPPRPPAARIVYFLQNSRPGSKI